MMRPKRAPLPELFMKLIDHRKLAKLMVIQGVTYRELAEAAGYKSHAYLGRLVRGEVDTLDEEPALRIARHLGVGVDDLFLVRLSTDLVQSAPRRKAS